MRLTVVGAGPAYSDDPASVGASYLLDHAGSAIVLDLGQGAFARLAARMDPSEVVAVLVSHLHPDHFVDLVPLRHYLRYQLRPSRRVRVVAPAGLAARLDGLLGEAGFTASALDVEVLVPGQRRLGSFLVEAARVRHTDDSFAFRLTAGTGPGLVYSGDVGEAGDLRGLVRRGDVLLVEVSFGPGPVPDGAAHLDGPAVGTLAAATGPSRVLLTHLQMGFDPDQTVATVQARFDGPIALLKPGDVLQL